MSDKTYIGPATGGDFENDDHWDPDAPENAPESGDTIVLTSANPVEGSLSNRPTDEGETYNFHATGVTLDLGHFLDGAKAGNVYHLLPATDAYFQQSGVEITGDLELLGETVVSYSIIDRNIGGFVANEHRIGLIDDVTIGGNCTLTSGRIVAQLAARTLQVDGTLILAGGQLGGDEGDGTTYRDLNVSADVQHMTATAASSVDWRELELIGSFDADGQSITHLNADHADAGTLWVDTADSTLDLGNAGDGLDNAGPHVDPRANHTIGADMTAYGYGDPAGGSTGTISVASAPAIISVGDGGVIRGDLRLVAWARNVGFRILGTNAPVAWDRAADTLYSFDVQGSCIFEHRVRTHRLIGDGTMSLQQHGLRLGQGHDLPDNFWTFNGGITSTTGNVHIYTTANVSNSTLIDAGDTPLLIYGHSSTPLTMTLESGLRSGPTRLGRTDALVRSLHLLLNGPMETGEVRMGPGTGSEDTLTLAAGTMSRCASIAREGAGAQTQTLALRGTLAIAGALDADRITVESAPGARLVASTAQAQISEVPELDGSDEDHTLDTYGVGFGANVGAGVRRLTGPAGAQAAA